MSTKLVPRPAATLILIRDGASGPEVLMLQRTQSAVFLGGAYVFPGGSLEGVITGSAQSRELTGMWSISDPALGACVGTWSASLMQ